MRILITDKMWEGLEVEEEITAGLDVTLDVHDDGEAVPEESWAEADAILVFRCTPLVTMRMGLMENCRMVVRGGVGFDGLDLEGFGARGIAVCNVPDYGTTEVADHAIAMALALRRAVVRYNDCLRADPRGNWDYAAERCLMRLRGTTFGIVGLGRIGTAAARRAQAFDMDVVFHDPYLPDGADLATGYRRMGCVEELFETADTISLHTPLSAETERLVDADLLTRAKPTTVLVNTSRGPVVDIDALHDALREGRIAGAALDVLPSEPPDDHPLIRAFTAREDWIDGRLLLSPHAAFYSVPGQRDLRAKAFRSMLGYLQGGELRNCVNRDYLDLAKRH